MRAAVEYTPPPSSRPPPGRAFELRMRLPPGVPHYVTPLTPVNFLLRAALIRPNKLAIVHPEQSYQFTYAEWAARVLSLALALQSVPGWMRGDRVAVLSPNVPLIADAHFGVMAAGGILTPLKYAAHTDAATETRKRRSSTFSSMQACVSCSSTTPSRTSCHVRCRRTSRSLCRRIQAGGAPTMHTRRS